MVPRHGGDSGRGHHRLERKDDDQGDDRGGSRDVAPRAQERREPEQSHRRALDPHAAPPGARGTGARNGNERARRDPRSRGHGLADDRGADERLGGTSRVLRLDRGSRAREERAGGGASDAGAPGPERGRSAALAHEPRAPAPEDLVRARQPGRRHPAPARAGESRRGLPVHAGGRQRGDPGASGPSQRAERARGDRGRGRASGPSTGWRWCGLAGSRCWTTPTTPIPHRWPRR